MTPMEKIWRNHQRDLVCLARIYNRIALTMEGRQTRRAWHDSAFNCIARAKEIRDGYLS
jgi:hypothetical protein